MWNELGISAGTAIIILLALYFNQMGSKEWRKGSL